ncbi:MAG: 2-C-methyl-D-erythritol 4-phosphate cytidylyltransferase [Bacteroidota bacterium]
MKKSVIIVAGGVGTRMNAGIPKQFLILAGKPLLMHSMLAFNRAFPGITFVVGLPSDQFSPWNDLCSQYSFELPHLLVAGGKTRFHSVKQALSGLPGVGLVAIHDGVRPLVSEKLIHDAFKSAEGLGNCIPVLPLNESLRFLSGETSRQVDRTAYRLVQTPQVFYSANIKKAYEQPFQESFTDDATVAESFGETIHLIQGDPSNIKITHPYDLTIAEYLFKKSFP